MRWMRWWWRQQARFEWFATYLLERRLRHSTQVSVTVVVGALSAVAVAMSWSLAGPHQPWERFANATAATTGAVLSALWLWRWPTLNQSRLFVAAAAGAITAASLAQSDPLAGLSACYAFIVLGGYIALLHDAKATVANFVISTAVAAALTWEVRSDGGDVVFAACQAAILALFSIGAPIVVNAMLHVMADDIARTDLDALTGLFNRRGFYRHTARLIDRCAATHDGHLVIAMVDIDDFKRLNDDYGHHAGDEALIALGRVLAEESSDAAVVARVGGEEFLIADLFPIDGSTPAALLCQAIAAAPLNLTASIGTSSLPISCLDHPRRRHLIDRLIAHADDAMYVAKTAGGNRYHHRDFDRVDDRPTLQAHDQPGPRHERWWATKQ